LLLRRRRLFGSIDYQPSAEMCFIAIGLLGRVQRISWCRVSRFITVTAWREGKRKIVAHIEGASNS